MNFEIDTARGKVSLLDSEFSIKESRDSDHGYIEPCYKYVHIYTYIYIYTRTLEQNKVGQAWRHTTWSGKASSFNF